MENIFWIVFLSSFLASTLTLLIYLAMKDAVNRNVSFFATYKNTKLYCLSFVYGIARDMKLEGKKDGEIQEELIRLYNAKSLPFMMSSQLSPKMTEAITFVGIVLKDANLLFTYVATPTFGKDSYMELLSKVDAKDEVKEAEFALKNILINDSDENIQKCMKWLPALCTRPFVEDLSECGNTQAGRNEALIYALFRPAQGEQEDPSKFVFKFTASRRNFVDCLVKLQKCYPSMEVVQMTAFNRQANIVSGGGQDSRNDKRKIYLARIEKLCKDFDN